MEELPYDISEGVDARIKAMAGIAANQKARRTIATYSQGFELAPDKA
jgi:hypothetical protein